MNVKVIEFLQEQSHGETITFFHLHAEMSTYDDISPLATAKVVMLTISGAAAHKT